MKNKTHVVIIQPPIVQLNTTYPSGAYLKSFFQYISQLNPDLNIESVKWIDSGNKLFHRVFSKEGLSHIFAVSQQRALKQALQAENEGNDNIAFNLRRYIAQQESWVKWILPIKEILTGNAQELYHEFVRSPSVPRGQRMENFLVQLERDASVDDVRILASLALADLADYITAVFDSSYSLVRYAESLATSTKDFSVVEKTINSPVLHDFYVPIVNEIISELPQDDRILVCISCPFPGTLAGALCTGKIFKEKLGKKCFTVMGGGYVNTELRTTKDIRLNNYIGALSFDRGYGSYVNLFDILQDNSEDFSILQKCDKSIYKMRLFLAENVLDAHHNKCEYSNIEDKITPKIVPDYSEVDFSKYPRLADSRNPMHRMWSDGSWLKAYLAHGCYWHKCAFCDTTLDYVCSYKKTNVDTLHESLYQQSKKLGVKGIHLVDEAAPPVALRDFALANLKKEDPLSFWGNIRYEKVFSRDLADLLAHSGMTGVSGGIEIASGTGLDAICKGTDIDSIVASCAAFKEAGILTHAYMIYGYWIETPQILVDSMETLRQMFCAGLLDSAFWHKFVITRYSRIFNEYLQGQHKDLKPLNSNGKIITTLNDIDSEGIFASNDLRFVGEQKSRKYTQGLEYSLSEWMNGNGLDKPVRSWFDFSLPKPSIPSDYIESSIARYERKRDKSFNDYDDFMKKNAEGFIWLGGNPFIIKSNGLQLCWTYMGEVLYADFPKDVKLSQAEELISFINSITAKKIMDKPSFDVRKIMNKQIYKCVRGNGLCRFKK